MAKKISDLARAQIVFWAKLSALSDLGLSSFKSVEIALQSTSDANIQQAVNMWIIENQGRDEFEGFSPLSEALEAFSDFFPPFVIAAIRASEESKSRQNVYKVIVDYLETEIKYG